LIIIGITSPAPPDTGVRQALLDDPNLPQDAACLQNVIDRMRTGAGYYDAAEMALRTVAYDPPKHYFPMRPFVTFRLPTLATFLAALRYDFLGQAVLFSLCFAMMIAWLVATRGILPLPCRALAFALMTPMFNYAWRGGNYVMHDVWAGALIGLSVALYSRHRFWSIACGLLAISIRELAVPFAVVMAGAALGEGKRRETLAWVAAIFGFFLFLGIHAWLVSFHVHPDDPAKVWMSHNGWGFVLQTAEASQLPDFAIPFAGAILMPLAFLGAAHWPGAVGRRLIGCLFLYAAGYMVLGNSDNWYWGFVYLPLMAVSAANAIPALADLSRRAFALRLAP